MKANVPLALAIRAVPGILAILAAGTGCGGSRFTRAGGAVAPLAVRPVEWNAAHVDVGRVDVLTDDGPDGNDVTLFGAAGATAMSGGAVLASIATPSTSGGPPTIRWRSAATITAPDGTGRWMVGVDESGRVFRVRGRSKLELVGERFALGALPIAGVTSLGDGFTLFALPGPQGTIALADDETSRRFDVPGLVALGGGQGHALLAFEDTLRDVDAARARDRVFALAGARYLTVGADGRLVVATENELYGEDDLGRLALRYETSGTTLHGLVTAGDRVWFADGPELGVIDRGHVAATTGLKLSETSRLVGSSGSAVWVLDGAPQRFAVATSDVSGATGTTGAPARLARWKDDVQPAFSRACAGCHLPGGSAGVDLSTADAWEKKRALIHQRVIETKSMPPKGSPLSDADRAAIDGWTK